MIEKHYDIEGTEVPYTEPDEQEWKPDNKDYVTAIICVLIGILVAALVVVNIYR